MPGATGLPKTWTLKPDSSGLLLPGACAVLEQNWDEAQREGSEWTEVIRKCPVRTASSGLALPGCHLLGFCPREQAGGGHEELLWVR